MKIISKKRFLFQKMKFLEIFPFICLILNNIDSKSVEATRPMVSITKSEYSMFTFKPKKMEKGATFMKKEAVLKFWHSHMVKTYPDPETNWSCSLSINTEVSSNHRSKTLNRLYCFCSHEYSCQDIEQFHLEADLVDIDKYLNGTNNFYKSQCEHGLNKLTNETSWTCGLQYDKIDKREFYCECKRDIMCQRHKVLKFQSHIRLVKE